MPAGRHTLPQEPLTSVRAAFRHSRPLVAPVADLAVLPVGSVVLSDSRNSTILLDYVLTIPTLL